MESKNVTIEYTKGSKIYYLEVEIQYYEGTYSIDPTEGEDMEYMGHTIWDIEAYDINTDEKLSISDEELKEVESCIDFEDELTKLF